MDSIDSPWMVEEWDSHWGGWRKLRASWDTEEPAQFITKAEAELVAQRTHLWRPDVRTRVVNQ